MSQITWEKTQPIARGTYGLGVMLLAIAVILTVWAPLRAFSEQNQLQAASAQALENLSTQEAATSGQTATESLAAVSESVDEAQTIVNEAQADVTSDGEVGAADLAMVTEAVEVAEEAVDAVESAIGTVENAAAISARVEAPDIHVGPLPILGWTFSVGEPDSETVLLIYIMAAGALGAGARLSMVGLKDGDEPWPLNPPRSFIGLLALPVSGAALAALFYFLLRAGLVGLPATSTELNRFTMGAIGGLVGLGADVVVRKLQAVIGAVFGSESPGAGEGAQDSTAGGALKPKTV